jgi:TonB family protein
MKSSYDAGELDAKPRLVNRPSATYPRDRLQAGVKEGRVLLEVSISTNGKVTVRRVISSSHADFTAMARKFASKARFSVPKKNGQSVTAIFRWPLILRP